MKVSGEFYAQWFDDGPVQAPPKSLVHGTLKWILKRLNEGLVQPFDGRPATLLAIGTPDAGEPLPDAMQLLDMLPEMRRRSFELSTLPLLGHASEELVDLLHEATRAHLLGLHGACVALCRAALERALVERVPSAELMRQRQLLIERLFRPPPEAT